MSANTPGRQKIIDYLTKLLSKQSLSSIKTTDIISGSNVSHQTFYRYFTDKYDAAESACYECLSLPRAVFGPNSTVREHTVCLLNIVKSHSSFFNHLLKDEEGVDIIKKTLIKLSSVSIDFRSSPPITNAWVYCLKKWSGTGFSLSVEEVYLEVISCYPISEVVFGSEIRRLLEKYGDYTMDELNTYCNSEQHNKI